MRKDAMPQHNERISYIDTTRGLLFCLMASVHAVTLSNLAELDFLAVNVWLRYFRSYQTFIILSGFTIALVFPWQDDGPGTAKRLRRRSYQLLAVMFVSNAIMLVLHHAVHGTLERIVDPWWWVGLLTLTTHYSISGILLPIAVLLLVTPALFFLCRCWGLRALIPVVLVLLTASWMVHHAFPHPEQNAHAINVLFRRGAGGFPVVPMMAFGAAGIVLGIVWRRLRPEFDWRLLATIVSIWAVLQLLSSYALPDRLDPILRPFLTISRFMVFLALGMMITRHALLSRALPFLPVMGKYALFSFIAHRVVMQSLAVTNNKLGLLDSGPSYVVYFVGTIALVTLLCLLRERSESYDRLLRRVYL
ncbi:MAG: acyltransferase [Gemmataceae bacterium]|nr:acyltransferase [Gemmataceae bacterium]